ncbi:helix-turn-helix domain-containing protein [Microbacterium sp. NPDC089695]|uniref:helix-turn-helix domain-containing protein n=1 Tax=Microbacterium sp. NPDC089695 TaxID=3364198 RepID=UPI0037F5AF52
MSDSSAQAARYLAPSQVAELLGIEVHEVVELVHQGRLRGCRLGSPPRWRIDESSIEGYLAEQAEETRRMALWRQANEASFPELWGTARTHGM